MRILLVAYDNDSYIHWFPQGLAYIAAVLLGKGHKVEIYNQDKFHYLNEHLTEYLDKNKFDAVGVSVVAGYYQYRKLLGISEAINRSKNRPFYILGGHGPSPEPHFFLKKTKANVVVIGEGEITTVELLDALANRKSFTDIKGIAFSDGERVIINDRRPLIKDIDNIPFPAYELFPIDYYRLLRMPHAKSSDFVMPVLSGRGCTFSCNFCYRMDQDFRPRRNKAVAEEIKFLKKNYNISYIVFSDELFMSSVERTLDLSEYFIKAKLNIKWCCNGRLNYAKPDILKLMKEAGCVFINYGIESMDENVLRTMNKALTVKQIVAGIKNSLSAGISPGCNIIFGNIGETAESLQLGLDFLLKYDDHAQLRTIRPVTPYPGSPLYYYAIEKGLLKDCEDFYENKHVNSDLLSINFTNMSDDEFHQRLYEANRKLIEKYYSDQAQKTITEARRLYIEGDVSFRGFRQS